MSRVAAAPPASAGTRRVAGVVRSRRQWPDAGIVSILRCGVVAVWEGTRRISLRTAEEEAVR